MRAGTLNRRVTLQQLAGGYDDFGQPITSWADVATVWANVRNLSGVESIKAGAEASLVRASIRIRYRQGITAGMRVVAGATVYNILAVLPEEQAREQLDLVCEVVQ